MWRAEAVAEAVAAAGNVPGVVSDVLVMGRVGCGVVARAGAGAASSGSGDCGGDWGEEQQRHHHKLILIVVTTTTAIALSTMFEEPLVLQPDCGMESGPVES